MKRWLLLVLLLAAGCGDEFVGPKISMGDRVLFTETDHDVPYIGSVAADGSDRRLICRGTLMGTFSGGRMLYRVNGSPLDSVMVAGIDGSGPRRLSGRFSGPILGFAPATGMILWGGDVVGIATLGDINGGSERSFSSEACGCGVSFSPDGASLAIAAYHDGDGGSRPYSCFEIVDVASGTIRSRILVDSTLGKSQLCWGPGESGLLYGGFDGALGATRGLFVAHLDGSFHRALGPGVDDDYIFQPTWSPDGERFAFIQYGKLWTADADGGNPRRLTDDSRTVMGPLDWSADGGRILFSGAGGSGAFIGVVDVGTTAMTVLAENASGGFWER